jgi:uncharacterized protein involved in exopolysaccharide biosynthesis
MMEEKNKEKVVIDLKKIVRAIKCNKLLYAKVLSVVFVLSCIYIYSVPRFYTCNVKLAPEIENSSSAGTLSSLASSVLGTSNMLSTDAISPNLYPDLTNSNDFIVSLFPIRVTIKEQDLHTNYYDYLSQYQKKAWWVSLVYKIIGKKEPKLAANVDPFRLTKAQSHIANMIKDNVKCSVDQKTNVITISVTDQNAEVSANIADSIREKLQTFITTYRTNKARHDLMYYQKLTREAKAEYEKARQLYGGYADANLDVVLESYRSKQEDLENDMQLKFNTYTNLNNQLQAAKAKVQERTPVFTILKGAAVPIKPSGPKRIIFVAVITLLTFIGTAIWIVRKDISDIFV